MSVRYEVQDRIAIITLDRPERKNALDEAMIAGLVASLERAQRDDEARVVMLTGAGDAFCAGGDMHAIQAWSQASAIERKNALWQGVHRIAFAMRDLDKPVIAAVNGAAVGFGLGLALMCDMRIASETARFAASYTRIGLVPGDGGAFLLPRLVGIARACELLFTGDPIDGKEAERIGLVNRAVPADRVMDAALDLARKVAAGPPLALRMTKRAVYQSLGGDLAAHLDMISSHMAVAFATEDHQEGVRAFLEKRPPRFSGR